MTLALTQPINQKTVMDIKLKLWLENIREWYKNVKIVNVFYRGKFPLYGIVQFD